MPGRNGEFCHIVTILEHIYGVTAVTEVPLMFCCPFWTENKYLAFIGQIMSPTVMGRTQLNIYLL